MRKFQFRLQTVLGVREAREKEMLRRLGDAQRQVQLAELRKKDLQTALADVLLKRELLGQEAVSVNAFRTVQDFVDGTKHRILMAEQGILRAKRGLEEALRGYLQARRQTRTLELLREKQLQEYKITRRRAEQREQDEMQVMRARFREASE